MTWHGDQREADGPHETRACPDCEQGKHRNCTGEAWDNEADMIASCPCAEARHEDSPHETSLAGLEDIKFRSGTQKHQLLVAYEAAYAWASVDGYTDEEAAQHAGLMHVEYWVRCGELRDDNLIEQVYKKNHRELTRPGRSGNERMVCAITELGKAYLARLKKEE